MPAPVLPVPPLRPSALTLLAQARQWLAAALAAGSAVERYAAAHRAALRAAAALLAARARPDGRRPGRPASAWVLLPGVAPEFEDWAAYFAAGAGKRAAAEAGLGHSITDRDADDLLHSAETFLGLIEASLGLPAQEPLDRATERARTG